MGQSEGERALRGGGMLGQARTYGETCEVGKEVDIIMNTKDFML